MRFKISLFLFIAAAAAFFLQIEWFFITLAVFAVVVAIAEAGSTPQATPRELVGEEEAARQTRQAQQVVMLQQPSLGKEFYEELVSGIVNSVFEKNK